MTIELENLEEFKTWLKACLINSYGWGTDCDSLSSYVVALIRKDKATDELRNLCLKDLEAFFNENTQKFVSELFDCLENKKYVEPYTATAPEIASEPTQEVAFIVDKRPDPMLKQKDRSPRRRTSPGRKSRSPMGRKFRDRSRSRSRSRDRHRRKRSRSPRRRRSRSPNRRTPPLRDLRDTLTRKNNGPGGQAARQRCRDFDEQGFCIQGELCLFDHGTDPVILENPAPYNPISGPVAPPMVPEYNPLDPVMRNPPPNFNNWNYQPGMPPSGPPHMGGLPPHLPPREVVQIARNVTPLQRVNAQGAQQNNQHRQRPFQRGTELEVRKIPRHQNTIQTLNEFFQKFGTVTNIQVNFQGCPESALISFSNFNEATAAYRSPEAVLGNRFIRLFWHNASNGPNPNSNQNSVPRNVNVNNNHQVGGKHPHPPHRANKEDGAIPKKMMKPNPEALKKDNQAEKTKQLFNEKSNFIDKYIEEHKKLLEKFEKCTSEEQKESLKGMIDSLSKTIEGLKPEAAKTSPLEIQTEKQLLDAELDLYVQIQEGNSADSKEIMTKLNVLRRRAKALGLIDGANAWHGKMAHKGILLAHQAKPKVQPAQLQLDKRTKVISVVAGDLLMAGLCKHLSRFGKISNVGEEVIDSRKTFVFTFATRKDAEAAVNRGSAYRGVPLNWSWKEDASPPNGKSKAETSLDKPELNASQEKPSEIDAEEDDPEEEERSRSWRH